MNSMKKNVMKTLIISGVSIIVVGLIIFAHITLSKSNDASDGANQISVSGAASGSEVSENARELHVLFEKGFAERAKVLAKDREQEKIVDSDASVMQEFNFIYDEQPKD